MSRIVSIGTASPPYRAKQDVILGYMQKAYGDDITSRKLNVLFHSSGIGTRYSVVPDFDETQGDPVLFLNGNRPKIEERLMVFNEKAVSLGIEAVRNAVHKVNDIIHSSDFTHLITVTCTGLHSPGLDAAFIREFHLADDIFHTAINFQGCNAAFPALKIADLIAKTDKNAKVLVVCVELCTLHFQPKNNHDNLLSNTIFGDGAAAVIILSDHNADKYHLKGFGIDGFYSCILDEGRPLMGWNITPVNFEMILDAGVPAFIGNKINDLMKKASLKYHITHDRISRWAVHPGGRKILDLVKKSLSLDDQKMSYSYKVLNEYGNMSSPTILFILDQIMSDHLEQGETVFSVGFGPGINVDTSLFTYA